MIKRWLDIPSLSQGNKNNWKNSQLWCGRASSSMIYNYYQKVYGKDKKLIINNHEKGNLYYPDGNIAAPRYNLTEPLNKALKGWERKKLYPSEKRKGKRQTIKEILQPVFDSLNKNNPILFYSGISRGVANARHIIVISGYRIESNNKIWLLIDDPATMRDTDNKNEKSDFLGKENLEILDNGTWYRKGCKYWINAKRLFEENDHSSKKVDLWCDHGDRPGFSVIINIKKTPNSQYSHGGGLCFPQEKFSKEEAKRLYKDSENDTLNYYPITAYGWWHNGVHLSGKKNDDIRAIADGKIIYTKLSRNEGNYGSPNFILIKHELEIDDKKVVFYSLYMHLKKVLIKKKLIENDEIPDWIKRKVYDKREEVQQGDKGKITAVYSDGSVTLYKEPTRKSDRLAELHVGDTFSVLEPPGSKRMKVKAKNKEGWINYQGKVTLFDNYELKNWVFDKDTKKIRKELFSDDLAYKGPVRVSAGEVIGYMGNGIEHLEVKEHSTTTTKKATLLHFEIFSRTKNNAGKDVYEYIDGKPENYFFLKDSDDDVIAEPLKEKKGNLINLYKGKDKDFANYLEKEFPEAFRTKESNYMFWDEIVLKDDEVKKFMNKYKEKFRDAVTKHISIWQAIGNKITYVNSDEDDKIEGLNTFHLFKNEKVLNKNEKLYFYNPIRFIEILYNKLSSQSVKDSKSVSPTPVASGKKLLVRKVKGPDISEVDKTVKYTAVEFSKPNPTDAEKKTINWVIKQNDKEIEKFPNHGDVLEYKIPKSMDGKIIMVMPYANSPTPAVSVSTEIGEIKGRRFFYQKDKKKLYIEHKDVAKKEFFGTNIYTEKGGKKELFARITKYRSLYGMTTIHNQQSRPRPSVSSFSKSRLKAAAAVSNNEGSFVDTQAYDTGILSHGTSQWTQHSGNLQSLIKDYKAKKPDLFKKYFTSEGISIQGSTISTNGSVIGRSTESLLLAYCLWKSGYDKEIQKIQLNKLADRIDVFYPKHPSFKEMSKYFTSENSVAHLLDLNVNRPAYVDDVAKKAVEKFKKKYPTKKEPDKWTDEDEKNLIDIFLDIRHTYGNSPMTHSKKRAAKINETKELSKKRGTFKNEK